VAEIVATGNQRTLAAVEISGKPIESAPIPQTM
jgi:hypothetical protein